MKTVVGNVTIAACFALFAFPANAAGQGPAEATQEQLKAAQEGFAKIGAKYEISIHPTTLRLRHRFRMPHDIPDEKFKLLPEVSFAFDLDASQTNLTDAGLKELARFKNLIALRLTGTKVGDAGMKLVAEFPALQELDISWLNISDAGYQELARSKTLAYLQFCYMPVTESRLRQLQASKSLKILEFSAGSKTETDKLAIIKELKSVDTLRLIGSNEQALEALKEAKQLRTLFVRTRVLTESYVKRLQDLDQIASLELMLYPTDAELKLLRTLDKLTSLNMIASNKTTNTGMKEVAQIKGLKKLYLPPDVTDAGVKELRGLTSLTTLTLGSQITDAAIADLNELTNLTTLCLQATKVTPKGLQELKGPKKLKYLHWPSNQKVNVQTVKAMANLTHLMFYSFSFTDSELAEFRELSHLRFLGIGGSKITDPAIAELHKTLPGCLISRYLPSPQLGWEDQGK